MYAKLSIKVQCKFKERRNIFLQDKFGSVLNNHTLTGKWRGYRSINVTGNYRALYKEVNNDVVRFVAIGTHSELYGK